jgi:predicted RNase H-like HicB family nuclease
VVWNAEVDPAGWQIRSWMGHRLAAGGADGLGCGSPCRLIRPRQPTPDNGIPIPAAGSNAYWLASVLRAILPTMNIALTAVFRKVPEGYIGYVEELPGANTQGSTLDEARDSLLEAVELVLEANRTMAQQDAGQADIREPLQASHR